MIRNLKVLGLALVAMAAMGALSASAYAAEEFHSETSGTTTLTGSQSSTNTFVFDSGTAHFLTADFVGTQSGATSTEVTLAPTYNGGRTTGFVEADINIDINGCEFRLTSKTKKIDIVNCTTPTTGIVITAPFCTINIPGGQELSSISPTNIGSGTTREIIVDMSVSNIAYHENGFACANSGSNTTGGQYTGSIKLTGTSGGSHVGVWYE